MLMHEIGISAEKHSLSKDLDFEIFDCRLGKKDPFCYWEWGRNSAQILLNESPALAQNCFSH